MPRLLQYAPPTLTQALVIHIVEAISTRLWFMLYTAALANLGEVLGWAARLWSNRNPTLQTPFIMQYVVTL